MSEILFYRQERRDGRIRTGLEISGNLVLMDYMTEGSNSDPSIIWYVDILFTTDSPIDSRENARMFLNDKAVEVSITLQALAERVSKEPGTSLSSMKSEHVTDDFSIVVRSNAMLGMQRSILTDKLLGLANEWCGIISGLPVYRDSTDA